MKTEFKASFLKAIKKIDSNQLKADIADDYRIGVKIESDAVIFVDIDHRSNIYRIFP